MRNLKLVIVLWVAMLASPAFSQGIAFEHQSMSEVLKQAEKANKLVFVDLYTDWCGPCKMMSKDVFTQAEVGDFFNSNFINLKVNAEKEGVEYAKKYEVSAYPTLVVINAKGELVYKEVGALDADALLKFGKNALAQSTDENSYKNLNAKYNEGCREEAFLKMYIDKCIELKKKPYNEVEQYLQVQTSMPENHVKMMEFVLEYGPYLQVGGKAEQIVNNNMTEYLDIATKKEATRLGRIQVNMVYLTRHLSLQNNDSAKFIAFQKARKNLKAEKQFYDDTYYQLDYIWNFGTKEDYKTEAKAYINTLITEAPQDSSFHNRSLAEVTSNYIPFCEKKKDYKELSTWIEYGKSTYPDELAYANIEAKMLYQMGKKDEAIAIQSKVVEGLTKRDRSYKAMIADLENMKKGEEI